MHALRRRNVGWRDALAFTGVVRIAVIVSFVLLVFGMIRFDPIWRFDGKVAGTVQSECFEPARYKNGTCDLSVRLDDGAMVGATATAAGHRYAIGEQVELHRFRTLVFGDTRYEVEPLIRP